MKRQILLPFIYVMAILLASPALAENNLILIQGGIFNMGSPTDEVERSKDETLHQVTLQSFYIGIREVTRGEYRHVMGSIPQAAGQADDSLPVTDISWYEAVAFCNALSVQEGLIPAYTISDSGHTVAWNKKANGYRLPTEAEWEYACRAGTETPFSTGNNITADEANYYGTYPYNNGIGGRYRERPIPAGSFAPNPWGLYDMHGNVWEWCWDWYGAYVQAPTANPTGPSSGTYRIYRGGGWNDFGRNLRSAYRAACPPENGTFNLGFRLARNAD